MVSAATVSAFAFSGIIASTGMIIWAVIGAVGMLSGMVSVGLARRRNQPVEPPISNTPLDAETQPATPEDGSLVSTSDVTQAA